MAAKSEKSPEPMAMKPVNPIAKKLQKILDSKLETDQEMLQSLETVSGFFTDNSLRSRRNLRKDLESRSLETNLAFLESFRKLNEKLESVTSEIEGMAECCSGMSSRLQATKITTRDLINQTTSLQNQTRRVEKKGEVVAAFLAAFQLTPSEKAALKGSLDGAISADFFPALGRLREIHGDCRQLLLRSAQHTAALQLMEETAAGLEAAYELLYRWIQRECRLLTAESVDASPLLCQAFRAMQERPALFQYSLDEFTTARRNNLVRAFIDALTRGGPGGVPKPMELLSHDALRYVGDMLGWIHQELASEAELVDALLTKCADHGEEQRRTILTGITDGLCRPFKVRVEQVLSGENGPTALYRLANLFRFYEERLPLAEKAALRLALEELRELTASLFFTSLSSHLQRLLEKMESPGSDLGAPAQVHQALLLLRDVLESHDATLLPVADKKANFERIFAAVLEPLGRGIQVAGAGLDAESLAVFLLNSLGPISALLSLYQYTGARLEMLHAQMEGQEDALVSEGAGLVLVRAGLSMAYHSAKAHQAAQGPMSVIKGLDPLSLTTAMQKFDLYLASPDEYRLPKIRLINSAKTRESLEKRTTELVLEAYTLLVGKIMDPMNGYANTGSIITKTLEQVRSLLL